MSKRKVQYRLPNRVASLFHNLYGDPCINNRKMKLVHDDPNIYLIEDFLSDGEINYLDEIITDNHEGFEKSFVDSKEDGAVYSSERTSSFIYLDKGKDRMIRTIEQRAADLIGVDIFHVEPLQIVRYTNDEYFNVHHDSGIYNTDKESIEIILPRRIVTIFVYLNNLPSTMGCTEFPQLDLKVPPKRGCAVMFCNVLSDGEGDYRVLHQANPVYAHYVKYGMNIWMCDMNLLEYDDGSDGVASGTTKKKARKTVTAAASNTTSSINKDDNKSVSMSALQQAEEITAKYQAYRKECKRLKKKNQIATPTTLLTHDKENKQKEEEEEGYWIIDDDNDDNNSDNEDDSDCDCDCDSENSDYWPAAAEEEEAEHKEEVVELN